LNEGEAGAHLLADLQADLCPALACCSRLVRVLFIVDEIAEVIAAQLKQEHETLLGRVRRRSELNAIGQDDILMLQLGQRGQGVDLRPQRELLLQKRVSLFLSAFPMLVPSLSW
jgi:hypothetical protein